MEKNKEESVRTLTPISCEVGVNVRTTAIPYK